MSGIRDVVSIHSNDKAFVALKSDGTVENWGHFEFGGKVDLSDISNVESIYTNKDHFVALLDNGTVV